MSPETAVLLTRGNRTARGGSVRLFASAARRYWFGVFPAARSTQRRLLARAEAIPDPLLRADALASHHDKGSNSEGLAALAVLAPGRPPGRGRPQPRRLPADARLPRRRLRAPQPTTRSPTASACTAPSRSPSTPTPTTSTTTPTPPPRRRRLPARADRDLPRAAAPSCPPTRPPAARSCARLASAANRRR